MKLTIDLQTDTDKLKKSASAAIKANCKNNPVIAFGFDEKLIAESNF
jgi:hypothetical protein